MDLFSDPNMSPFTESFASQWLNLRDVDFTSPRPRTWPLWADWVQRCADER